ncbi:MAG: SAF domain-containing protein [Micropruina sp.]|uniref:SAF domain-containing protein n=1 Tax=Micropruina sp. TaxID=2737536 RepID=UPI0039E622DC
MTDSSTSPATATVRPRRNLRWILIGVLAICLGGLGSAVLYLNMAEATSVLKVNRTVYRGEVIGPADLGPVSLGSHLGVETVPAERADELVGKTALVDLANGSLLTPSSVGEPEVRRGFSRLGLKLNPGQVPVSPLPSGTPVMLVPTTAANDGGQGGAALSATVAVAPVVLADGSTSLEVMVADAVSDQVARLAAAGRIVVVKRSN